MVKFTFLFVLIAAVFATQDRQLLGCKWYDVVCHGTSAVDALGGAFDDLGDDIKNEFNNLGDTLKNGLQDATEFAKLSAGEVASLSGKLLAESKAVVGMTGDQLKAAATKVHDMTVPEIKTFVGKLNKDTLNDALGEIGKVADWTEDQAKEIIVRIEKDDMFGKVETWTKDTISKVGNLMSGVSVSELVRMSDKLISDAVVAAKLTAPQIGKLVQKTGKMLETEFKNFYNNVNNEHLKNALDTMGKGLTWGRDKVKLLYNKLEEENFFGNISTWTVETFNLLGDIVGPIVMEGKVSHINKDTFKQVGTQVIKGVILADTFKDAVFEVKVEVLGDLAIAVSGAFGSDAKQWTKDVVAKVGPAIIAFKNLDEIPGEVLAGAIPGILNNGFDWRTVQGMATDFANKLKKSDAYGIAKDWTKEKIAGLGDMLPAVATSADISSLNKDAFKGAVADLAKVADKKGFDTSQLEALAQKAKEAFGAAVKDWNVADIKSISSMVSGVTAADLKTLANEAVAAITPAATELMDKVQLNSLGAKLSKLADAAKNTIVGEKVLYLTKEAKMALFKCIDTCKEKFVDVTVKLRDTTVGQAIEDLIKKAANVTSTMKLPSLQDFQDKLTTFRLSLPSSTDIDAIKSKVDNAFSNVNNVVDDQLVLELKTVAIDPQTAAKVDQVSGAITAAPTLLAVVAAMFAMVAW